MEYYSASIKNNTYDINDPGHILLCERRSKLHILYDASYMNEKQKIEDRLPMTRG